MLRLMMSLILLCSFGGSPVLAQTAFRPPLPLDKSSIGKTQARPKVNIPLIVHKGLVVIDPGHGGSDVGTQSVSEPRYLEKSLNLVTAQFVRSYLQQLGYEVFMTRQSDVFISLEKRAELANEKKPALFVSIHYNSAPSAQAHGVEVFFYHSSDNKHRMIKSKKLAQVVLKHILAETEAKSRGVKQANYAVIRLTKMPAILVEGGFVTNDAELQKLKNPDYLKKIAWGISQGINEYLSPQG
jgi:N-acetylmuramoyl-L-alanine amidase